MRNGFVLRVPLHKYNIYAKKENIVLDIDHMADNSSDEEDPEQYVLEAPPIDKIRLIKPILAEDTKLECSSAFSSSPTMIHFGGLSAGVELTQTVNIINRSSKSQRFLIIPPSNDSIHLEYEKKGHLAPGMAQKVIVRFKPLEFKYYYDTIRVRGEEDILLIPIHGYPLLNEVNFPNTLSFGDVPLCENAVRVFRLKCSIPVNFKFRLEVAKLHPFFRVTPLEGIIPANDHIEVKITFTPIALGACVMPVRLYIEQHGFNPIECVISGRSVSGLIEKKQLEDSRLNLANHLVHRGVTLQTALGNSTFSDMTLLQEDKVAEHIGNAKKMTNSNYFVDPTAIMLANTFRTSDLQSALDTAIKDSKILHQKTPALPDGTLKALLPVKPRGPGSGLVFDAGSQWISAHQRKQTDRKVDSESTINRILPSHGGDHIISGLRVPAFLDHTTSVSYVLTQEEGKLKPKDLKIAIEKNRADRELKAKEQKKIRDQVGDAGMLDLRGILAEERLNVNEGDSFQRQLRELAFSMEVDDVRKLESEKEFRVSEEFIGTTLLSEDDVAVISHQRKKFTLHKKQREWQGIISRQHSSMFSPSDMTVRAGAPMNVFQRMCSVLTPSFDANSNDLWSKRLNTLRRFVGLVSRWIYRKRSNDRMKILQTTLTAAGVTTWEEGREFVTRENATYRSRVGGNKLKSLNMFNPMSSSLNVLLGTSTIAENGTTGTVAAIVCSFPHHMELCKQKTEATLDLPRAATMPEMARRNLFPRFIGDEGSIYEHAKQAGIDVVTKFDDRSVLPLIVRPEYFQMEYTVLNCPEAPIFFPNLSNRSGKSGALDEASLRPPADGGLSSVEIAQASPTQSAVNSKLCIRTAESPKSKDSTVELSPLPSWLGAEPAWVAEDLDLLSPRPNLRLFTPEPLQQETDIDWLMRPFVEDSFDCDSDGSLRTK